MDLQHLIEVFFTMWFFITPIVYPIKQIPLQWRTWYDRNPMVGIIELVHSVFLGESLHTQSLMIAIIGSLGVLVIGLLVFRRLAPHCTEV